MSDASDDELAAALALSLCADDAGDTGSALAAVELAASDAEADDGDRSIEAAVLRPYSMYANPHDFGGPEDAVAAGEGEAESKAAASGSVDDATVASLYDGFDVLQPVPGEDEGDDTRVTIYSTGEDFIAPSADPSGDAADEGAGVDGEGGGSDGSRRTRAVAPERRDTVDVRPTEMMPTSETEIAYKGSLNAQFQRLLSCPTITPQDELSRRRVIESIMARFVARHRPHVQTIVMEKLCHVPPESRSIKPVNIGGIAGGEKFVHDGVLFKFALDVVGLYGGDDYAAKVAKHELRGLNAIASAHVPGVHVPLQAVYDYMGYRVTATALLPIDSDTLKHGSSDGGETVQADPRVCDVLSIVAQQLNLKPHRVGGKLLHFGGDVEGHVAANGQLVVIDTARVMPPQAPEWFHAAVLIADSAVEARCCRVDRSRAVHHAARLMMSHGSLPVLPQRLRVIPSCGSRACLVICLPTEAAAAMAVNDRATALVGRDGFAVRGDAIVLAVESRASHLVHLLRPEAVKASTVPLSPDAFCGWGSEGASIHNAEVADCTRRVLREGVSSLAEQLASSRAPECGKEADFDCRAELHRYGLNLRHLGICRAALAAVDDRWAQTFLVHMIARAFRKEFNSSLRNLRARQDEHAVPDELRRQACLLAETLFRDRLSWDAPSWSAVDKARLKTSLYAKFPNCLLASEWDDAICLWQGLPRESRFATFMLAASLTGAKFQFHTTVTGATIESMSSVCTFTLLDLTVTDKRIESIKLWKAGIDALDVTARATEKSLALSQSLLGSDHPRVAEVLQDLAMLLELHPKRAASAEPLWKSASSILSTLHGFDSVQWGALQLERAQSALRNRNFADAILFALPALAVLAKLEATGRAVTHRSEVESMPSERTPVDDVGPVDAHRVLFEAYLALGRLEQAAEHLNAELHAAQSALDGNESSVDFAHALASACALEEVMGRRGSSLQPGHRAASMMQLLGKTKDVAYGRLNFHMGRERTWAGLSEVAHSFYRIALTCYTENFGFDCYEVCDVLLHIGDIMAVQVDSIMDKMHYYNEARRIHDAIFPGRATAALLGIVVRQCTTFLACDMNSKATSAMKDVLSLYHDHAAQLAGQPAVVECLATAAQAAVEAEDATCAQRFVQAALQCATDDIPRLPELPACTAGSSMAISAIQLVATCKSLATMRPIQQPDGLAEIFSRVQHFADNARKLACTQLPHACEQVYDIERAADAITMLATVVPTLSSFGFEPSEAYTSLLALGTALPVDTAIEYLTADESGRGELQATVASERDARMAAVREYHDSTSLPDGGRKQPINESLAHSICWFPHWGHTCSSCNMSPIVGARCTCIKCKTDYCTTCSSKHSADSGGHVLDRVHNTSVTWAMHQSALAGLAATDSSKGDAPGTAADTHIRAITELQAVHEHPLTEVHASGRSCSCDVCSKHVLSTTYHCAACDFDCCSLCLAASLVRDLFVEESVPFTDLMSDLDGDQETTNAILVSMGIDPPARGTEPPGWDALRRVTYCLYPTEYDKHVQLTARLKFWGGGPDPLDFVSVFRRPGEPGKDIPDSWHYVSFGMSDMFGDGRVRRDWDPSPDTPSGFGFEFTFRLKCGAEESAPLWPAHMMNDLARYRHSIEAELGIGHNIPQMLEKYGTSPDNPRHVLLARDPVLCTTMRTFHGTVDFYQLVGITQDEYLAAVQWNGQGITTVLKLSSLVGRHLVTDMARTSSVFESVPLCRQIVAEGTARDGGSMGAMSCCCNWRSSTTRSVIEAAGAWNCTICTLTNSPGAQHCAACGNPNHSPSGVTMLPDFELQCDSAAAKIVSSCLTGRILHGAPFMFTNNNAGSGAALTRVALMTEGVADHYFASEGFNSSVHITNADTPFAQVGELDAQVFISRRVAAQIATSLQQLEESDNRLPLPEPRTITWPDLIPGLTLSIDKEEKITPITGKLRAPGHDTR